MKQIILGTAGHIDHGKTSLIKAVSGYDTDRLIEEKRRGITIELGFAALDLPSGTHIGIVDVPGHEKFVKHMVAGATGIDVVTLIIAADEGVMPQTREHLEICTLLGVKQGLIALTKIDMVDEEWRELVQEDIRDFVAGTFLEGAPIVPVSSLTGEGTDAFIKTLDDICADLPGHRASGLFRLPVDRVFTMKGFGTVITGTLISGKITVGEMISIYPTEIKSKVRGLQVHDLSVNEAEAGQRTAINFQGIEKASVNRGDVIARPDTLKPSFMLDVEMLLLKSMLRPIKNRERVRLHTGTSEIPCNIILLDRDVLEPGESANIQLRLDSPVNCVRDDRFVIRSYSPVRTLGGGRILNPLPQKHKRFRKASIEHLSLLLDDHPENLIRLHAIEAGFLELSYTDLILMTNLTGKPLDSTLQMLMSKQEIIQTDRETRKYIHRQTAESFSNTVIEHLTRYHSANSLKAGMPKGELRSRFPALLTPRLFNQLLEMMVKSGAVIVDENTVRLPGHSVVLESDQTDIKKKILDTYAKEGLQPPYFKELVSGLGSDPQKAKNVLMLLVNEGSVIKVKEDLFFHTDAIRDIQQRLILFLKQNGEMTTPQFKEMTGASRKYTIPLLEYFDARNVTIRVGDSRRLRKTD